MAMVYSICQMETYTKVNLKITKYKENVCTLVKMVKNIKDSGLKVWKMVMEFMNGLTEGNTKDNTNKIIDMEMVQCTTIKIRDIPDNGKMDKNMVRVSINRKNKKWMEFGIKEN